MRPRLRTRLMAGLGAAAMAAALVTAPTEPATATTTGDWWYDAYGVAALHAEGWTGAGVKVAVIDSNINPDLPVFAGRNLKVDPRPLCAEVSAPTTTERTVGAGHGATVVAQIIGSGQGPGSIRGIAPDAEVTFYSLGTQTDDEPCTAAEYGDQLTAVALGVQRALDDGAQIITTSVAGGKEPGDSDVIANAIAKGVIVIASGPNPTTRDLAGLREYQGVIVASAVDEAGRLNTYDDGRSLVYPRTTVVAPGVGLTTVGSSSGGWDSAGRGSGSSFAAPLVAGTLALAEQRSPDATSNQLMQALLRNTGREPHELSDDRTSGFGFGLVWPANIVRVDATTYPDENLLLGRVEATPTAAQIADAAARASAYPPVTEPSTTSPAEVNPRSDDSPTSTQEMLNITLVAVSIGFGLVVIAAGAITVIIVMRRSRRKRFLQDPPEKVEQP